MPSVCLYFQVHQPYRLKSYTYSQVGTDHDYFDNRLNREIAKRVCAKSYLPTNAVLLKLIRQFGRSFKVAFSISGIAIEQMRECCPEALESFRELAATGNVEFLGESYFHTLASLYDRQEFITQVKMHTALMQREFGATPRVFRNTELLFNDAMAPVIAELGFSATLVEGADDILGWRSPNFVYRVPGQDLRLLVKNYRLSDDIAFRFASPEWNGRPLTAELFAERVSQMGGTGDLVGLFMDYETFGEHVWEESGILGFLEALPAAVMAREDARFLTPSDALERFSPLGELPYPRLTSWADVARDDSAWRGNHMQNSALRQIYELGSAVSELARSSEGGEGLLEVWRRLQTSDHFYYMSTKWHGDGQVHSYFSPFESPYAAFIAYMNVLRDFKERVERRGYSFPPSESHVAASSVA